MLLCFWLKSHCHILLKQFHTNAPPPPHISPSSHRISNTPSRSCSEKAAFLFDNSSAWWQGAKHQILWFVLVLSSLDSERAPWSSFPNPETLCHFLLDGKKRRKNVQGFFLFLLLLYPLGRLGHWCFVLLPPGGQVVNDLWLKDK